MIYYNVCLECSIGWRYDEEIDCIRQKNAQRVLLPFK